jgi:hypothetical protein
MACDTGLGHTCGRSVSYFRVFSGLVMNESEVTNLFHSFDVKVIEAKDVLQVCFLHINAKVSDVKNSHLLKRNK